MAVLRRLHPARLPREFVIALVLAAIHGVLYVFVSPPWQHYDEPSHFEYAAYIARHGNLPDFGTLDIDLRRDIAQSMERTGFYRTQGRAPDIVLASGEHVPNIGYLQQNDPPPYYALASLPIRVLSGSSIEMQVRGARLVSVLLLLVAVACAWGIAREMTPPEHALRAILPIAAALMPTLVELMSSVSNDAIAIASVSVFAWAATRFVARGGWLNVLWLILSAASTLAAKNTALIALPVLLIALPLGAVRGKGRRWVWMGFALAGIAAVLIAFAWGDPAGWYRNSAQNTPLRCESNSCGAPPPAGQHAFGLNTRGEPAAVLQVLDPAAVTQLPGKRVTLGAYVWADADGVPAPMPALLTFAYGANVPVRAEAAVTATLQPVWHTFTATVPADASYASIEIAPQASNATVYYDGVTLRLVDPPETANLVRNGSAEDAWLWLRVPLQRLVVRYLPDAIYWHYNFYVVPFDGPVAQAFFGFAVNFAFNTFWARFAWANVEPPQFVSWWLLAFSIASLLATAIAWPRWRTWLRPAHAAVLGALLVLAWGFTLLRGAPWLQMTPFLNTARYGFPAILPTLGLIWLGWSELARPRWARWIAFGWMGAWALFCLGLVATAFSAG